MSCHGIQLINLCFED